MKRGRRTANSWRWIQVSQTTHMDGKIGSDQTREVGGSDSFIRCRHTRNFHNFSPFSLPFSLSRSGAAWAADVWPAATCTIDALPDEIIDAFVDTPSTSPSDTTSISSSEKNKFKHLNSPLKIQNCRHTDTDQPQQSNQGENAHRLTKTKTQRVAQPSSGSAVVSTFKAKADLCVANEKIWNFISFVHRRTLLTLQQQPRAPAPIKYF